MNQTEKLVEALQSLIEWDKKYPPQRIYPTSEAKILENNLTEIVEQAKQALESYKDGWVSKVREALKEYVESEGCGCCGNYDKHNKAADKLGELLGFDKYSDGSGYDLRTIPTPPQADQ